MRVRSHRSRCDWRRLLNQAPVKQSLGWTVRLGVSWSTSVSRSLGSSRYPCLPAPKLPWPGIRLRHQSTITRLLLLFPNTAVLFCACVATTPSALCCERTTSPTQHTRIPPGDAPPPVHSLESSATAASHSLPPAHSARAIHPPSSTDRLAPLRRHPHHKSHPSARDSVSEAPAAQIGPHRSSDSSPADDTSLDKPPSKQTATYLLWLCWNTSSCAQAYSLADILLDSCFETLPHYRDLR